EGALTIPAKTFSEFVRTLRDDQEIKIQSQENNKLEIQSGKTRCVLLGLPKEDFPVFPDFPEDKAVEIETKVLLEMVKKTSSLILTDKTGYILTGTFCIFGRATAKMIPPDARRLPFIARPLADKTHSMSAIVPSKAMLELPRLLTAEESAAKTAKVI